MVKRLTRFEYNSFNIPERPPIFHFLVEEFEWYSDDTDTTVGVLFRDMTDNDWAYVILQADSDSIFKCVAVDSSYENIEGARTALLSELDRNATEFLETGTTNVAKNLSKSIKGGDPFRLVVPFEKQNPLYRAIAEHEAYSPAREMIREVYNSYVDLDGNFIQQFQTTGFDSRIWELYLHAYLIESEFSILPSVSPDFMISKGGVTLGIEAVTANPTQGSQSNLIKHNNPSILVHKPPFTADSLELDSSFVDKEENFVPIRLGSALYSKLKKRYWDKENMDGRPLILAIETFHDRDSLKYTSSGLGTYLYGFRHEHIWDKEGNLIVVPRKIESHSYAGKTIPSGFFFLPEAEYISAVLFSNSGTISKFNRMGHAGAYHSKQTRLFRRGLYYNPDPNASSPIPFAYEVGDPKYPEWWGQGLDMFHNPNAVYPVEKWVFPGIAHHRFEDGIIYTDPPIFHPLTSMTINVTKQSSNDSLSLKELVSNAQ